jgi:hypothetical protein
MFLIASSLVLNKISKSSIGNECKALDENGNLCTFKKDKGNFCSKCLGELLL